MHPRYPVYVPSKGRADKPMTANMFIEDKVDFRMVVEPQEVESYAKVVGGERICVLPKDNGGLVYARNWIKEHATSEGHERHWQFDDDIRKMIRLHRGYRIPCSSGIALAVAEEFVDRYENVALASFNSEFFIPASRGTIRMRMPPFYLNARCYTCFLVLNSLPNHWRFRYNEDTDMSLQVLADGWCTILFNAFLIKTPETMTHGGGQTDIYVNDGRLKMARELERVWPGVVVTRRRFGRPQHAIKNAWNNFTTELRYKPHIDRDDLATRTYDLRLDAVAPVKDRMLRRLKKEMDKRA